MPVAKGSTIDPERTRATILHAATPVLYERGLDGIGVAELCSRLGVSKETLYRHFGTKDGLVRAMLEARSDRVINWLTDAVLNAGDDPAAQLTALFAALQSWYDDPTFRGCALLNAATQHHTDAVRTITARHLDRYLDLLTKITVSAGTPYPHQLAQQLLILVEGATIVADHHTPTHAGGHALQAALTLLAAARHP
ncbi:TetR/AcrR family transcriptional regulator [Umezawaea sp. Da 62-37]|uniref:TetR/AcrR family transcriptional regulator n=1 Tax=Umezawaea sp. Da 62-37 TaxID=3075927 RepID=UPI0028F73CBA|nr:TetR/AcrR family transcriptional regulator [Umezawaea sp. Da 62-37]WNV83398.1 TetR/AcrR family transcriptional regulator [Umezawaea sp. Da 62-37]